MSSKKEKTDAAAAAADRIKAAALTAAKGLSRTQAERAAAAAARNVNAYGQKEEGPSRWQERKEAKRQMYLMSTEKAVKLGVRKDPKLGGAGAFGGSQQCQKCFQLGHWTYECKNERVYISRPTRTQQLANPKLRPKLMEPEEVLVDAREAMMMREDASRKPGKEGRIKRKSKRRENSSSESESESDSDGKGRIKRKPKRKPKRKEKSSSESDSDSDSDSDRKVRKKRRARAKRRESTSSEVG